LGAVRGDPDGLRDLARALDAARDALADVRRVERLDAATAGHPSVSAALHTQAAGLERQRSRAIEAAGTLGAFVEAAAQALDAADGTVVTVQVRR
jgi:hypothetical protein